MATTKRSKANDALSTRPNGDVELFEMIGDHIMCGSAIELDLVTKREIGEAVRKTYSILLGLAQVAAGQEDEAKAATA